jgi:cell division protein FtsB
VKTKTILIILAIILIFLQYRLWFGNDGLSKVFRLRRALNDLQVENEELVKHNNYLINEIIALKKGGAAIENRARSDLGMIKNGEVFYQVVK